MAVPKGRGFRIVEEYRAVNQLIEQEAMPMPCLEDLGLTLEGEVELCSFDMIQGYCRTPLRAVASGGLNRYSVLAGDHGGNVGWFDRANMSGVGG